MDTIFPFGIGKNFLRYVMLACVGLAIISTTALAVSFPLFAGGFIVCLVFSISLGLISVFEMDRADKARVDLVFKTIFGLAGPIVLIASVPYMNAYFADGSTNDGNGWFAFGLFGTIFDLMFFLFWRADARVAAENQARKEAASAAGADLGKPGGDDVAVGD